MNDSFGPNHVPGRPDLDSCNGTTDLTPEARIAAAPTDKEFAATLDSYLDAIDASLTTVDYTDEQTAAWSAVEDAATALRSALRTARSVST
jgi:hypothetical protein